MSRPLRIPSSRTDWQGPASPVQAISTPFLAFFLVLAWGGPLHGQSQAAPGDSGRPGPAAPLASSVPLLASPDGSADARASAFPTLTPAITPRGAFLRSLVVPGWGHLAADSPTRAAFYIAAQGGAGWMLGRSLLRRQNARRFREAEFDLVRDELQAGGIQSPDSLRVLAEGDARVARWDELVGIRGDQVEDWVALSLFLALLGATDALVAAHMADFPEALTFTAGPGRRTGAMELGLSLAWPRRMSSGR